MITSKKSLLLGLLVHSLKEQLPVWKDAWTRGKGCVHAVPLLLRAHTSRLGVIILLTSDYKSSIVQEKLEELGNLPKKTETKKELRELEK